MSFRCKTFYKGDLVKPNYNRIERNVGVVTLVDEESSKPGVYVMWNDGELPEKEFESDVLLIDAIQNL